MSQQTKFSLLVNSTSQGGYWTRHFHAIWSGFLISAISLLLSIFILLIVLLILYLKTINRWVNQIEKAREKEHFRKLARPRTNGKDDLPAKEGKEQKERGKQEEPKVEIPKEHKIGLVNKQEKAEVEVLSKLDANRAISKVHKSEAGQTAHKSSTHEIPKVSKEAPRPKSESAFPSDGKLRPQVKNSDSRIRSDQNEAKSLKSKGRASLGPPSTQPGLHSATSGHPEQK